MCVVFALPDFLPKHSWRIDKGHQIDTRLLVDEVIGNEFILFVFLDVFYCLFYRSPIKAGYCTIKTIEMQYVRY